MTCLSDIIYRVRTAKAEELEEVACWAVAAAYTAGAQSSLYRDDTFVMMMVGRGNAPLIAQRGKVVRVPITESGK